VRQVLGDRAGPFIAASDYMKIVPDQIRQWVPGRFIVLGTDGYGLSDIRSSLRRYFEIDAAHITVAVLEGLAQTGDVKAEQVSEAIERFELDPDAPNPRLR
jgi:pyruvate dehydrogenase E1 component